MDMTTRPEDHQLGVLLKNVPKDFDSGSHAIVMNHPDIHWPQLRELIEKLPLDGVFRATMHDTARWFAEQRSPVIATA